MLGNYPFSDDMKPSRKYSPVSSCLLKCECKNEDCHYGNDPCACNRSNPCPVNFTMNRMTGGELPFACWVILHAFLSADFFHIQLFQKNLSGILLECQTVWILIWVAKVISRRHWQGYSFFFSKKRSSEFRPGLTKTCMSRLVT